MNALKEIQSHFLQIDRDYDRLHAACTTEAQRKELRTLRDGARDVYFQAVADGLQQNSKLVEDLTAELKQMNLTIKRDLLKIRDIASILSSLRTALLGAAALGSLAR